MTASPLSMSEASKLFEPLERLPRIALAVSGGPDSVCLLHALHLRVEALSVGAQLCCQTDGAGGMAQVAALVEDGGEGLRGLSCRSYAVCAFGFDVIVHVAELSARPIVANRVEFVA